MKSIVFVVEDNADILFNIKLLLEANNYQVITATNGKEALKVLTEIKEIPNVIISDIMMPKMDGYDFFREVSENPRWSRIPFIFLSARTSPEDIRFGKILGVDDYLTKPFKEEDLLAIISGKIARYKKIETINKKIEELFLTSNIDNITSIYKEEISQVVLLVVMWDDYIGPKIEIFFPKDRFLGYSIKEVGLQLFQATVSIYGQDKITKAEGLLLNIKNINRYGYIYFDSYPDDTARAGKRQYMIGVIAPKINYLVSLKIKEILQEISHYIKEKKDWDIKNYRKKISDLLSTPPI